MANIGATTALYKVETALTKANTEVTRVWSVWPLVGQCNAGDRSSYVAMGDTFRLDYVGTKSALKSAAVVQGYSKQACVFDSAYNYRVSVSLLFWVRMTPIQPPTLRLLMLRRKHWEMSSRLLSTATQR